MYSWRWQKWFIKSESCIWDCWNYLLRGTWSGKFYNMIFGWKWSHFILIGCTDLSCSLSCIQHVAEDSHAFLLRSLSFWSQDLVSTWFSLWILNTVALTYSRTIFNIAKPSLKRHLVVVVLPDFAHFLLFALTTLVPPFLPRVFCQGKVLIEFSLCLMGSLSLWSLE